MGNGLTYDDDGLLIQSGTGDSGLPASDWLKDDLNACTIQDPLMSSETLGTGAMLGTLQSGTTGGLGVLMSTDSGLGPLQQGGLGELVSASSAPANFVVVESGDTLWGLAEEHLGDGSRWPELYEVNRGVIGNDPRAIEVGMVLSVSVEGAVCIDPAQHPEALVCEDPNATDALDPETIIQMIHAEAGVQSRESWSDAEPNFEGMEPHWEYTTIVIHHSGNSGETDPKEIESKHMDEKGWDDIGYHFMIKPDGSILEARRLSYKGSHVREANSGKIGILVMGDFEPGPWYDFKNDEPAEAQLASLDSLTTVLKKYIPGVTEAGGHTDYVDTECPGDLLYEKLDEYRHEHDLGGP